MVWVCNELEETLCMLIQFFLSYGNFIGWVDLSTNYIGGTYLGAGLVLFLLSITLCTLGFLFLRPLFDSRCVPGGLTCVLKGVAKSSIGYSMRLLWFLALNGLDKPLAFCLNPEDPVDRLLISFHFDRILKSRIFAWIRSWLLSFDGLNFINNFTAYFAFFNDELRYWGAVAGGAHLSRASIIIGIAEIPVFNARFWLGFC